MRVRCKTLASAALTLVLLAPAAAAGEKANVSGAQGDKKGLFQSLSLGGRKEPVRIHSDSLDLDYKGSTLTYRGKVQVTQGDVTLSSERLVITYDRDAVQGGAKSDASGGESRRDPNARIKEVVAEGDVRIRQGDRLAEGRRAVFDQARQTIVLSDGAVLHEGPNQIAGDRIVVYLQEERSVVEGGANSRVQAIIFPESAPQDEDDPEQEGTSARRADEQAPPTETPQR